MAKILYVVHRYYPYPGGSEYYVRNMAEETLKRGHEVWVYTLGHQGDQHGVFVTSDREILSRRFDLIVVHGDCHAQNHVLANIPTIPSPVLYMLIKPGENDFIRMGLRDARFVAYSTEFDRRFMAERGVASERMVYVPHGINDDQVGRDGFRDKHGIKGRLIVSCGGFWPHKGHVELADFVNHGDIDATLVVTGYWDDRRFRPANTGRVRSLLIEDYREVLDAIRAADYYVMNSYEEGFGLVLLESMLNRTAWLSRRVGGAVQLSEYGFVYDQLAQTRSVLSQEPSAHAAQVEHAYRFVTNNHLIRHTVDAILATVGR